MDIPQDLEIDIPDSEHDDGSNMPDVDDMETMSDFGGPADEESKDSVLDSTALPEPSDGAAKNKRERKPPAKVRSGGSMAEFHRLQKFKIVSQALNL